MLEYRCYFLDPDGRIASQREFEAHDDEEGKLLAAELYALYAECAESHDGWELWQGKRLVISRPSSGAFAQS
jgi:hypothetical protein